MRKKRDIVREREKDQNVNKDATKNEKKREN